MTLLHTAAAPLRSEPCACCGAVHTTPQRTGRGYGDGMVVLLGRAGCRSHLTATVSA